MKTNTSFFATVVLLSAFTAFSPVHAVPSVNDGDIFLGIRNKVSGTQTYVIDLGSFDNFYNNANPVTPYSLNQGFTAAALVSDLNTFLGGGWYNNANVVYGLFGGYQAGSSSSISGLPDNALVIGTLTSTPVGNIADQTINTLTGYAASIGSSVATSVGVSSAWVNNNGSGTWDGYQYGGTANAANGQGSSAYGFYPGTLETQVGNTLYANTVYSSDSGANNGKTGALIGAVTLASDGTLSLSAVPEPSTYILFGLGALLLVIASRRRSA